MANGNEGKSFWKKMSEVCSDVGSKVKDVVVDSPTVYPVAIDGLSERGVYVVRIITGEGNVYQGKVISGIKNCDILFLSASSGYGEGYSLHGRT